MLVKEGALTDDLTERGSCGGHFRLLDPHDASGVEHELLTDTVGAGAMIAKGSQATGVHLFDVDSDIDITNNQITSGGGDGISLGKQGKSTPVTREGSRIAFKLPFDPPSVVIEGDKMTATAENLFVDYWERVR